MSYVKFEKLNLKTHPVFNERWVQERIAEDITSRFLNVISRFNGTIPLIAIQMNALKTGDNVGLVSTTVLDQVSLGLVDEDEEVQETTDRSYWEKRGTQKTVALADEMLEMIRKLDPTLELKYNKFYIGLARNGQPPRFVPYANFRSRTDFESV